MQIGQVLRANVRAVAEASVNAVSDGAVLEELSSQIPGVFFHFFQSRWTAADVDAIFAAVMSERNAFISDNGGYFSEKGSKQRRWKMLLTVLKLTRLIPFKQLIQDEIFPCFSFCWHRKIT